MRSALRLTSIAAMSTLLAATTVVVATPAHAASGSFSGGVLTVAFSQPDDIRVEEAWDSPGTYRVISYLDNISISGCTAVDAYYECVGVTKAVLHGSSGNDTLTVSGPIAAEMHGGAGADLVQVEGVRAATLYGDAGDDELYANGAAAGVTIHGGDGNDMVNGSDHGDTIHGGAGNDHLDGAGGDDTIHGDAGDDWLLGDDGNDTLHGDDGNDTFTGGAGADSYHGGAGADVADYHDQYAGQSGVHLSATLDGAANDGAAGEGDNINADGSVENIDAGDLNFTLDSVTLVGDDGPNMLKGYSPRSMTADGRGGDDLINVSSMQTGGVTVVQGGSGNDSITTNGETSTVDGGAGNDTIYSGKGHDTVTGGPGIDSIDTGYGNDVINSRDGEVDRVSCGVGADTLVGDKIDVVNADPLALCEAQDLAGSAVPSGPDAGTISMKISRRTKVTKRGVVKLKVTNGFGTDVALKVRVKAKKPKLTVAKAKAKVGANATRTVKVKLTKKALRTLKRKKKLKVTITLKATDGAEGKIKKKTTLRR